MSLLTINARHSRLRRAPGLSFSSAAGGRLGAVSWERPVVLLPRQLTNNATQGTGTSMTDVFCCDWSQVLLGERLSLELRVLNERYAEAGQVGIMAYWRVQLVRLSAMGVYLYLQAAA